MNHPIQPPEKDESGIIRFKENRIVTFLLDEGPFDMNKLAMLEFSREDREQFAQLIGYSLSGASDLSYMSDEVIGSAYKMTDGTDEKTARLQYLEETLKDVKKSIKEATVSLFNIHPDDLEE